jgi:hypothetical protein
LKYFSYYKFLPQRNSAGGEQNSAKQSRIPPRIPPIPPQIPPILPPKFRRLGYQYYAFSGIKLITSLWL